MSRKKTPTPAPEPATSHEPCIVDHITESTTIESPGNMRLIVETAPSFAAIRCQMLDDQCDEWIALDLATIDALIDVLHKARRAVNYGQKGGA